MDLFCEVCDRSIIENESEYMNYLATLLKKDDSLYKKIINNVNLDEVDEILNDYISFHNENSDLYFVNCEFVIEFDNNFTGNVETNYLYNIDDIIIKIKAYLLYWIDCYKSRGFISYNINRINVKTIIDRCNMTYKHYNNQPMSMCESKK